MSVTVTGLPKNVTEICEKLNRTSPFRPLSIVGQNYDPTTKSGWGLVQGSLATLDDKSHGSGSVNVLGDMISFSRPGAKHGTSLKYF